MTDPFTPAPAAPPVPSLFRRLMRAVLPATLVLLAAEWLARKTVPDACYLQMGLASGLLYIYLPAYAAVAAAWRRKGRRLAAASGLLVILHLCDVLPGAVFAEGPPEQAGLEQRLPVRAATANLAYGNTTRDLLAAEAASFQADILCLPEYTPDWVGPIAAAGIAESLPHSATHTASGPFGLALFSRWPLEEWRVENWEGVPTIRAVIGAPGRRLVVWACHPPPPRPSMFRLWQAWHTAFEVALRADAASGATVIALGDFNCTPYHACYRAIVNTGVRSAHAARGREISFTWGNWEMAPNLIRIDHVFVTPDIAVLDVREGTGAGSDHRPVVADLAVR